MITIVLLALSCILLGVVLMGLAPSSPGSTTPRTLCILAIAFALFALLMQVVDRF